MSNQTRVHVIVTPGNDCEWSLNGSHAFKSGSCTNGCGQKIVWRSVSEQHDIEVDDDGYVTGYWIDPKDAWWPLVYSSGSQIEPTVR